VTITPNSIVPKFGYISVLVPAGYVVNKATIENGSDCKITSAGVAEEDSTSCTYDDVTRVIKMKIEGGGAGDTDEFPIGA
jgi:hypothetical protein